MMNKISELLDLDLPAVAQLLRNKGRNNDRILAHITPEEARFLKEQGGSGELNPYTGLPEFDDGEDFGGGSSGYDPFGSVTVTSAPPIDLGSTAFYSTGDIFAGMSPADIAQYQQELSALGATTAPLATTAQEQFNAATAYQNLPGYETIAAATQDLVAQQQTIQQLTPALNQAISVVNTQSSAANNAAQAKANALANYNANMNAYNNATAQMNTYISGQGNRMITYKIAGFCQTSYASGTPAWNFCRTNMPKIQPLKDAANNYKAEADKQDAAFNKAKAAYDQALATYKDDYAKLQDAVNKFNKDYADYQKTAQELAAEKTAADKAAADKAAADKAAADAAAKAASDQAAADAAAKAAADKAAADAAKAGAGGTGTGTATGGPGGAGSPTGGGTTPGGAGTGTVGTGGGTGVIPGIGEPTQPTTPTTPSEPTKPTAPPSTSTPTEPTKPLEPIAPTQPTEPTTPEQPATPAQLPETRVPYGSGVKSSTGVSYLPTGSVGASSTLGAALSISPDLAQTGQEQKKEKGDERELVWNESSLRNILGI